MRHLRQHGSARMELALRPEAPNRHFFSPCKPDHLPGRKTLISSWTPDRRMCRKSRRAKPTFTSSTPSMCRTPRPRATIPPSKPPAVTRGAKCSLAGARGRSQACRCAARSSVKQPPIDPKLQQWLQRRRPWCIRRDHAHAACCPAATPVDARSLADSHPDAFGNNPGAAVTQKEVEGG